MAPLLFHHLVEKDCKMSNLNDFELCVLNRVAKKFPEINVHIPFLRVKDRIVTGVGMYVNFCYVGQNESAPIFGIEDKSISTNESIEVDGLKYGLGYEVDISDDKINFIEFFTYGESWDGNTKGFKFN